MTQTALATQFVDYVVQINPDVEELDRTYLTNALLALVGDNALTTLHEPLSLLDLTDMLVALARQNQKGADSQPAQEILEAQLMDLLTPRPSTLNRIFWNKYRQSPKTATDYFFALSQQNDYIKTRGIAKNIAFPVKTAYGTLQITINLSKPEKDPKAIAAALTQVDQHYPQCQLCLENEGYLGRLDYPARTNHRVIRLTLNNRDWGFQYSPYAYFNEHSIFLDTVHEPMAINQQTFRNLLDIVTRFPHYFVGSNADLPIVGGSMLTHDHYQGGRHVFPMAEAPIEKEFSLPAYPTVTAGIVKWPMSCLRLQSQDSAELVVAADHIATVWKNYSDETVSVRAYTKNVRHHTVTPIARKNAAGAFELDLVLRDNQTSTQYPDGIFHPHQDVQHIKKENIGLIEVMGLAVLPARLKSELAEVKKYWLQQPNNMKQMHKAWADEIAQQQTITADNVDAILKNAVGQVFLRVLKDAGVFKRDALGQAAFQRFIRSL